MSTTVKIHPELTLIACVARDGGIGFENQLLWRHPLDMQHFRQHTVGHTVLMGRLTWESLPTAFRPLPHRDNVVLSRNPAYAAPGAQVVSSLEQALALPQARRLALGPPNKVFVIGGSQLYKALLPQAAQLILTEVDAIFKADRFFPPFNRDDFKITPSQHHTDDQERNFRFVTYLRR